ncbi:MAG: SBBP repeat-containing protein [Planctomycetota bacterium]|nr:SBBP repeat-containing protein [Planctomycetota bacterium]
MFGDGGPATAATLDSPSHVVVDVAGNIYISQGASGNARVRKVTASTGVITTVAGNGNEGFTGDGGPAASSSLYYPRGIALDSSGNLYIVDSNNSRIRMVDAQTGTITTVAGSGEQTTVESGDGGPAISASLGSLPVDIAIDRSGNMYIASMTSIRKVDKATGIISTIVKVGTTSGLIGGESISSVALDSAGNVFFADNSYDSRVYKLDASGTAVLVAGNGTPDFTGDGGPATAASLKYPKGLVLDGAGNLYIADNGNGRVRKVTGAGTVGGAPLGITKTQVKLNFKIPAKDSMTFGGTVAVPQGFIPANQPVIVNVAAFQMQFPFDAKGKASGDTYSLTLSGKKKDGAFIAPPVKFALAIKKSSLLSSLSGVGFTNSDVPKPGTTLQMPFSLTIGGTTYSSLTPVLYIAKANTNGSAKKQ